MQRYRITRHRCVSDLALVRNNRIIAMDLGKVQMKHAYVQGPEFCAMPLHTWPGK